MDAPKVVLMNVQKQSQETKLPQSSFELSTQIMPFESIPWGLTGIIGTENDDNAPLCFCVPSQIEATRILDIVEQFLKTHHIQDGEKFKIAFTEALSNALYHAQGIEKGQLRETPLQTSVECELGIDKHNIYACIRDYSGSLTLETIEEKCQDHALANPLDNSEGGRGLCLMAILVDEMIIQIAPQYKTEMILIQAKHMVHSPLEKPHSIRVVTTLSPTA